MQYYRTFIALPVIAGEALLELRSEIKTALAQERISWVDPANFHITLRFLGDTSPGDVDKISGAIKSGSLIQDIRAVKISGVGSFGPAKKPRVIWAALGQELWFREMKAGLDACLEDLGFPSKHQEYTPHLTLGRIRSLKNVPFYQAFMKEIRSRACDSVSIDRMVYYRSILGSGAPEYRELAEIRFK